MNSKHHDHLHVPHPTDTTRSAPANALLTNEPAAETRVPRMSSRTLFAGALEVEIEHNGSVYRLRQTSLGKLILTK